jgi:hypothetical protein
MKPVLRGINPAANRLSYDTNTIFYIPVKIIGDQYRKTNS